MVGSVEVGLGLDEGLEVLDDELEDGSAATFLGALSGVGAGSAAEDSSASSEQSSSPEGTIVEVGSATAATDEADLEGVQ